MFWREDQGRRRVHVLHGHLPADRHLVGIGSTEDAHGILAHVVLQLLHEAQLSLVLHGLVGRSVLTHAERVVAIDELHRRAHQGSHAESRFHIV